MVFRLISDYLQVSEVSRFAESVYPSSAESERSEILLERVEEFSRTASSDLRRVVDAVVLDHVVRAVHVIVHVSLASRAESFDGVNFVFLKASLERKMTGSASPPSWFDRPP